MGLALKTFGVSILPSSINEDVKENASATPYPIKSKSDFGPRLVYGLRSSNFKRVLLPSFNTLFPNLLSQSKKFGYLLIKGTLQTKTFRLKNWSN
jgi:hypothetical protein